MKNKPENQKTQGRATSTAQMYPRNLNLRDCIKALSNNKNKWGQKIRIKHDREWNEIQVEIEDRPMATVYIDLGHTQDDKITAIEDLYGTIKKLAEH